MSLFFVAELSANHNQDLERALTLVDRAAEAGAHAVKLQTYTPDTMTREGLLRISGGLWDGRDLYNLYKDAMTPWEWHKPIFDRCKEKGMLGFSTPFDKSSVDFLETLEVPMYKIASFEITDLDLITYVASKQKPMLISTGMATLAECRAAYAACLAGNNSDVTFLKCTSAYPSEPRHANLHVLRLMCGWFPKIGLSDHTPGHTVAVASIAMGARVIEKHLTLDKMGGGPDDAFSMEPEEFKIMVEECKKAYESLGTITFGPTSIELKSLVYRRSVYAVQPIRKGEEFTRENTRTLRPAFGLCASHYAEVLGKQAQRDIVAGSPLNVDDIANKS